ncbi:PA2778 family cysteine peptidase [Cognatiyoonia sp. IB215446]|uniref:PA2778 family cysteine peptidase n=1 Tax=Cognatiyoonia sp. IB215446 TaxID=3097355 RepID=UPI002A0D2966|nr:PA2778 family cysteine peptidase [Cognatiyoonia sp. IB215446]MDX8346466.1 PA2778 family cysteine peptidase [Cognatiyoonia sp. IB215446]
MYPLSALRRVAFLLIASWIAACAPAFDPDARLDVDVPTRAQVANVPLIRQADFYCGPASIAMVMQWAGADIDQEDVAWLAFSPGARGTYLADMIGSSRRLGQLAVEISTFDQLLSEIDAGHPVIVFQNLGLGIAPVWHYGVVTGYDFGRDEVYLNSGQLEQMVLPFATFERTWRRGDYWGLVVLPPDDLPVSVPEPDILSAGAALERVGQLAAAETLYETGAARWPYSWIWQFGLANARYGQGDLRGARTALRQAQRIDPSVPEIRNNLAQVNHELAG